MSTNNNTELDIEIYIIETFLDYLNGLMTNTRLISIIKTQLGIANNQKNTKITLLSPQFNQLIKFLENQNYNKEMIREVIGDIMEKLSDIN